jgi:hypothetical protein
MVHSHLQAHERRANGYLFEDGQLELVESSRVGDHIDLSDLPFSDYQAKGEIQLSTRAHDDSHSSVHQSRLCESRPLRVGKRFLGDGPRAADLCGCACRHGGAVDSAHNVRVEHCE